MIFAFASGAFATTTLTYEYDANGNLIHGDGKYYEYNDANQLVKVRHGDANGPVLAEYFYDYTGQRIKKVDNGVTDYYIGKHYEKQTSSIGSTTTSYYFANGERVAKKDSLGNVYYYHLDHLGGTNIVTDSSGNLVERTKYYPFGEIREGGNEKYSFTGKEKDKLTDFYYFEARYYNPEFKHFTQADTVAPNLYDPQDLNRYAYVRNNPVKFIDPTGHYTDPSGRHWNKEENYHRWVEAKQQEAYYQQEAAKAWGEYAKLLIPKTPLGLTKELWQYSKGEEGDACGSGPTNRIIPDKIGGIDCKGSCQKHDINYGILGKPKLSSDIEFGMNIYSNNQSQPIHAAAIGLTYAEGVMNLGIISYWSAQYKSALKSEQPIINALTVTERVAIDPSGTLDLQKLYLDNKQYNQQGSW